MNQAPCLLPFGKPALDVVLVVVLVLVLDWAPFDYDYEDDDEDDELRIGRILTRASPAARQSAATWSARK